MPLSLGKMPASLMTWFVLQLVSPLPVSQYNEQWRHNERDGVSNHQPHDCLLNRLSRRRSKKTSKLRVTGLCAGNSPVTGEFPAQRASNAGNVSIWWRHHDIPYMIWLAVSQAFQDGAHAVVWNWTPNDSSRPHCHTKIYMVFSKQQ